VFFDTAKQGCLINTENRLGVLFFSASFVIMRWPFYKGGIFLPASIAAVVLAAGEGKRMNSAHPKVCCEVLRKPMLSWVLDTCSSMGVNTAELCVVLAKEPGKALSLVPQGAFIATQVVRRGTGHAVSTAAPFLEQVRNQGVRDVCILSGDVPFADAKTMNLALAQHRAEKRLVTVLSAVLPEGGRYGRMIRENEQLVRIVEAADATTEELSVREINAGVYWLNIDFLQKALPCLTDQNAQGEIYLTDLVGLANKFGGSAGAFVCPDPNSMRGANTRSELADLNFIARQRVFKKLYDAGVDIPQTDGVLIGPDVTIGRDTVILQSTLITGRVTVGEDCIIGPFATVADCTVNDKCVIEYSHLECCRIGKGVRIGPFSQICPGSVIEDEQVVGSFVKI
jgi:bifunctional UDP-N-acetylglucosamine pyrophosphorylase/glucosamine-1-phosphate N-acetyltransferase